MLKFPLYKNPFLLRTGVIALCCIGFMGVYTSCKFVDKTLGNEPPPPPDGDISLQLIQPPGADRTLNQNETEAFDRFFKGEDKFNEYVDPELTDLVTLRPDRNGPSGVRGQAPSEEEAATYESVIPQRTYRGAIDPTPRTTAFHQAGAWSAYPRIQEQGNDAVRTPGGKTQTLSQLSINELACAEGSSPNSGFLHILYSTNTVSYLVERNLLINEVTCPSTGVTLPVVLEVAGFNDVSGVTPVFFLGKGASIIVGVEGSLVLQTDVERPAIFTYAGDPLGDIPLVATSARWGGLYFLGKAPINSASGSSVLTGFSQKDGAYGGTDPADDSFFRISGTEKSHFGLSYVSLRYAADGITLAGVGESSADRPSLRNIEILNGGNGLTLLGGTVNVANIVISNNFGTAITYAEGYRGVVENFIINHHPESSRGIIGEGGGELFSKPLFINGTLLGSADTDAILLRNGAGGLFYNCIFTNYRRGVIIERTDVKILNAEGIEISTDAFSHIETNNIDFRGNLFHNIEGSEDGSNLFAIGRLQ